jgi:hypothetical protein
MVKLVELNKNFEINCYLYKNLDHNMSIFSKKINETKVQYNGAIYFNRPGKKTSISPIYLSEEKDIKILKNYFEHKLLPKDKDDWIKYIPFPENLEEINKSNK